MCGIAGFLGGNGDTDRRQDRVHRMVAAVRHRGPDAEGFWTSADGALHLGHARLSIQDLSDAGAQPMSSGSGRYVISYNGEVYNFPTLRLELEKQGHRFRGHSDTEVMLAAIEEWGLEGAVSRFVGMFAFALWDDQEQRLYLVRDRIGIKPLYYRYTPNAIVFGSELKSIRAYSESLPAIDRGAVALYLRHNYVPAPYTIYSEVFKLAPGTILTAQLDGAGEVVCDSQAYWSVESRAIDASNRFAGSYPDAVERLDELLGIAVRDRLIADVPLGGFLSGGVDSSTVVSLMQHHGSQGANTFTIGFSESSHNEAPWAKRVAEHLGTRHREMYVRPEDVLAVVPDIATVYDEPFSDSSQIPTILISRLARQDVTVCLSGDGGDELFAGYRRYDAAAATWRSIGWLPRPMRRGLSGLAAAASGVTGLVDPVFGKIYDAFGVQGNRGNELQRAATILRAPGREALYLHMMSHWKDPASLVKGVDEEPRSLMAEPHGWMTNRSFRDYMMLADTCTYLPDDILTKVDRASMSVSLEARVPMLDHRVVEFALGLPLDMKRRNGNTKSVLRDVLARYLPVELIDRPKMGFSMPIDRWLRGALRDWANDLLSVDRIERDGLLEVAPIQEKWREHQSGERNWGGYLWDVLMLQTWLDAQDGPK